MQNRFTDMQHIIAVISYQFRQKNKQNNMGSTNIHYDIVYFVEPMLENCIRQDISRYKSIGLFHYRFDDIYILLGTYFASKVLHDKFTSITAVFFAEITILV